MQLPYSVLKPRSNSHWCSSSTKAVVKWKCLCFHVSSSECGDRCPGPLSFPTLLSILSSKKGVAVIAFHQMSLVSYPSKNSHFKGRQRIGKSFDVIHGQRWWLTINQIILLLLRLPHTPWKKRSEDLIITFKLTNHMVTSEARRNHDLDLFDWSFSPIRSVQCK